MLPADYAFVCGEGNLIALFVVRIRPFGVYVAPIVDATRTTDFAIGSVYGWVLQCGLVRFVYRSDRGRALKYLLGAAVRESGREAKPPDAGAAEDDVVVHWLAGEQDTITSVPAQIATPEHSSVGESQSNGAAERSVQRVEDQARTAKAALEG